MAEETQGSTSEQQAKEALLALLAASLHKQPAPEIGDVDLAAVCSLAKQHAVVPLLYPMLSVFSDDPACTALITRESQENAHRTWRLLLVAKTCINALEQAGISCVLLKGISAGAYWPEPEMRKSGDLDILPLDQNRFDEALTILHDLGFTISEKQVANHQVVLYNHDGIELELHKALVEDYDNELTNEYFASFQDGIAQHVVQKVILGVELPVLDEPTLAFHLLAHMLQDFLRHGFGLRLLCDWTAFWEARQESETAEAYLAHIEAIGAQGFSATVTACTMRYLGLSSSVTEQLIRGVETAAVENLMQEILDAGDFGYSSVNRMVVPRGTDVLSLAREFHHQMTLNYPEASKIPVTWPALWTATLARFLYNNKKVRGTTVSAILKTAGERSQLHQQMAIFQHATASEIYPSNIAEQLSRGEEVRFAPQGWSMWPTILPGKDEVTVRPANPNALGRGDIVLYRRAADSTFGHAGDLVLHRIVKLVGSWVWLRGDNQFETEGPLNRSQIIGVLAGIQRAGKVIPFAGELQRVEGTLWNGLLPARKFVRALRQGKQSH